MSSLLAQLLRTLDEDSGIPHFVEHENLFNQARIVEVSMSVMDTGLSSPDWLDSEVVFELLALLKERS